MNIPFSGSDTTQQACLSWWHILSHWHVSLRLKEHHSDEEEELLQQLTSRQKPCWPPWCRAVGVKAAMLLPWFPTASQHAMRVGSNLETWTSQKSSPTHAMKPDVQVMEVSWQRLTEERALQSLLSTTTDAPFPSMRWFSPHKAPKGSQLGPVGKSPSRALLPSVAQCLPMPIPWDSRSESIANCYLQCKTVLSSQIWCSHHHPSTKFLYICPATATLQESTAQEAASPVFKCFLAGNPWFITLLLRHIGMV